MFVQETPDGVVVKVKVQPRSSRNHIAGLLGDALKVNLTAPPVDGEANEALVKYFAGLFKVPRSSIHIISGHTGRNKLIRFDGCDKNRISGILGPFVD